MSVPGPSATGLLAGIPTTCMDDQFGPWAGPYCRSGFDFTLLFEETILTIPVNALLLYLAPIRIMQLLREDRKTKANWQATAKLVSSLHIVFLQSPWGKSQIASQLSWLISPRTWCFF